MQCQLAFSPLVNSTLGLLLCLLVALGGPAVALAALCLRLQRGSGVPVCEAGGVMAWERGRGEGARGRGGC